MIKPILQVGVKVLLKNDENRYLLLHRSIKKYPNINGRWDIPGGLIDPGSNLMNNLKREVKEETGLVINSEPILIAAQDIIIKDNLHVVRLTYKGVADGVIELDTNENDLYAWFTREEILKLDDIDVYFSELIHSELLYE